MGYGGAWLTRGMGYERVDCSGEVESETKVKHEGRWRVVVVDCIIVMVMGGDRGGVVVV
jgi:hypothetical protein